MVIDEPAGTRIRFVARPVDPGLDTAALGGAIVHAVGSRAESVRLAPVVAALRAAGIAQAIVRPAAPGEEIREVVDPAGLPRTERLFEPASGTEVQRIARALSAAESFLVQSSPGLLVLSGESDSTLALALAASKLDVPMARVGAGHRYGDFSVPEEVNRMLGDRVAELLFTEGALTAATLRAEGVASERIHMVGSTAVDLVRTWEGEARRRRRWRQLGVAPDGYVLATLHRAENVGSAEAVARIVDAFTALAERVPVVLVLHPWTLALMEPAGDVARLAASRVHVSEPLAYLDFLSLQQSAAAIVTDSGGVQEEASALGVPCYTLRRVTDRSSTLTHGSNVLLGANAGEVAELRLDRGERARPVASLGDGRASRRIAGVLARRLDGRPALGEPSRTAVA